MASHRLKNTILLRANRVNKSASRVIVIIGTNRGMIAKRVNIEIPQYICYDSETFNITSRTNFKIFRVIGLIF